MGKICHTLKIGNGIGIYNKSLKASLTEPFYFKTFQYNLH